MYWGNVLIYRMEYAGLRKQLEMAFIFNNVDKPLEGRLGSLPSILKNPGPKGPGFVLWNGIVCV